MYLCIDILPNRIESILSCLSYILRCYSFHASVSGTGRTGGDKGAGLPGHLPAWPRLPNKYPLRNRGPYQCGAGPASGRCHTRNEG